MFYYRFEVAGPIKHRTGSLFADLETVCGDMEEAKAFEEALLSAIATCVPPKSGYITYFTTDGLYIVAPILMLMLEKLSESGCWFSINQLSDPMKPDMFNKHQAAWAVCEGKGLPSLYPAVSNVKTKRSLVSYFRKHMVVPHLKKFSTCGNCGRPYTAPAAISRKSTDERTIKVCPDCGFIESLRPIGAPLSSAAQFLSGAIVARELNHDPMISVSLDYHVVVTMKDGTLLSGRIREETPYDIVLDADAEQRRKAHKVYGVGVMDDTLVIALECVQQVEEYGARSGVTLNDQV